jgi:hypothetical protein
MSLSRASVVAMMPSIVVLSNIVAMTPGKLCVEFWSVRLE